MTLYENTVFRIVNVCLGGWTWEEGRWTMDEGRGMMDEG